MRIVLILMTAVLGVASTSYGVFLDATGHYGLLGELRSRSAFGGKRYQAIRHSFSLLSEARHNDRLSLFLEMRLFPNQRTAFLGDRAQPRQCAPRYDEDGHLCHQAIARASIRTSVRLLTSSCCRASRKRMCVTVLNTVC